MWYWAFRSNQDYEMVYINFTPFGTSYAKSDRREPARAELSAAIDLYRAMEMTSWLPQAEAALAQIA
jgi:hypothetical protein